jgi:Interleukin-like EMT inducer
LNELSLEFDSILPYDRLNRPPLSIVVRSAGEEQGDFGHIYVNGVDESPNARGYNIVVIDPQTGAVDARENFDTFASEQESARMAQFIAQIPNGKIVAVAVRDEASLHLTQAAVDGLKSLGAKQDLHGKFRWSHAILATKGNPEDAREAASEITVSQVFNAALVTEPDVAATMGEIRIEPLK